MTRIAAAPGIYPNISYQEYERWEGVRHSDLRHYRKSPAHARFEMTTPRAPSAAMDLGNAYHCAVLEPERFAREYVRGLEGVGNRSQRDKDIQSSFRKRHFGKTVIDPDEFDLVGKMAEALFRHETAAALLRAEGGFNEVVAVWKDAETGLPCKLRADRLTPWMGWTFVIDLKTTRDASPEGWPRECHQYGYDSAAAWYLSGLDALAPRPRRFLHISQEKVAPFAVAVHELDEPSIAKGRARARRYLRAHAAAIASGDWPAYPIGILPCSLPGWSLRLQQEDDEDAERTDGSGGAGSTSASARYEV